MPPRFRPAVRSALACLAMLVATGGDGHAAGGRSGRVSRAAEAQYDYVFTIDQRTRDQRGRVRREPALVARVRTRGALVRADFLPATEGSNRPGDWYLTRDGGRTMTLVFEPERSYQVLDVAAVRERLRDEKGLDLSVADLEVRIQPEGACGEVAGWAARCVTVERRYTVRSRYWVMRTETQVAERVRYWLAPALADLAHPFDAFFVSRTDLLVRRDSTFLARDREVRRALGGAGLLRMEGTLTETNGRARTEITRTIETYRVRRATHDDALFDVPVGYRLVRP